MTEQTVLIIDDEPDIRELLEITLLRMGLDTVTAGDVQGALEKIEKYQPNLCLTDMKLPDGNGIDIVRYLQKNYPHIPVAVITAFGSMDTAVAALKAGAYDFVSKPVDLPKLRELIQTALKLSAGKGRQTNDHADEAEPDHSSGILGHSPAMQQLKSTINKLARSQAPVYIHGESGSGKELVAHQIHLQGSRLKAPFVPVNCGAIPENLMESEFFGHKKGSFTGAVADKQGLFQAAHRGTLFLDEVADLPLTMQVKLLRAIQEGAIKPVGGLEEIPVDVRILSATHKSLEHEVAAGRFRQDLYYRLNVIKLKVPPLRERQDDILLLADFFLHKIAERWQMPPIRLSPVARAELAAYAFPGNVRELENILERASTLCDNNTIQPDDLQLPGMSGESAPELLVKPAPVIQAVTSPVAHVPEPEKLPAWNPVDEDAERDLILRALDQTRWNRTKAAEVLGMTFRQLRYRIQKYGLDEG
ncbi:MAG TPA: sigma-54 dependent transcriptional regulator [Candidatus Thiothrix moscowensis]|uniref:sigma-54-dependent transcriptional regulator n=1 Tax=unclassified Thiothrix TaxID=2636184 RepID=UPI001A353D4B|nr:MULTISPECIES: sigma-54 dependent transcriptional regulator [unclassified Thiothrix]MBJ6610786.1 sigma-54-dependent Fis family transcriptional regulator [Candidatus Thiothrix moscowensis]HRJ51154.1 sigma-54 dependent transcriptional regulator [Candidatus Thiothrix moscowensis]HRJ91791.1 sigma-54 dependent transcriptional regulator [Candidatus Thiothrix moscowensis]